MPPRPRQVLAVFPCWISSENPSLKRSNISRGREFAARLRLMAMLTSSSRTTLGHTQHQGTLNKALKRIIRDCNDEVLLNGKENPTLLPPFSCHILRHTFTTRMCEAGVNIKVIQDTLGHADVSTTLNIYADATKDLKKSEFSNLDAFWNQQRGV